jgi:hypothetical protein
MKSITLTLLTSVAMCGLANAAEIRGTYAIVAEDHCVEGPVGSFNSIQVNGTGTAGIGTVVHAGFITFNANGTGSITSTTTSVYGNFAGGALIAAYIATQNSAVTFTYRVNGDEYVRTSTSEVGTYTTGARTGQTITVTGSEPTNGVISENNPSILLESNAQPTLETWTFSNGDVANAYCSYNRTLTKVREAN